MWKHLALALFSLALALGSAEIVLRVVRPGAPDALETLRASLERSPGRLFRPGLDLHYDARGLYADAPRVRLRVSPRRLIEPDPVGPADRRVLFLGGSTTEALYVPADQRWVARLGRAGTRATHNAGVSGANSVDAERHLRHLIEVEGLGVDLVVLKNTINDLVWLRRLHEVGASFQADAYAAHVASWLRRDDGPSARPRLRLQELVERLVPAADSGGRVLDAMLAQRDGHLGRYPAERIGLEACPSRQDEVARFGRAAETNLARLHETAVRHGAQLLVLSEATSYGAPATGFHRDLRLPLPCGDALLHGEAARAYLADLNRVYLAAAARVGAHRFDLAAALDAGGPDGGRLMYDSAHLTIEGSRRVAAILAPVLDRELARLPHDRPIRIAADSSR